MNLTRIIVLMLLMLNLDLSAQNLVFNPSFELYSNCPTTQQQIENASGWINPLRGPWDTLPPLIGDYANSCGIQAPPNIFGGFQYPKTGNAYIGMYSFGLDTSTMISSREYIQAQLLDTLEAGSQYYVEFSVSRVEGYAYTHSSVGLIFTDDSLHFEGQRLIIDTPDIANTPGNLILDSALWYTISGVYIAQGTERYLCLGNFLPDSLVDTINNNLMPFSPACICSYFYYDDVVVSKITGIEEHQEVSVNVFPNPAKDKLTVEGIKNYTNYRIADLKGRIVKKGSLTTASPEIDLNEIPTGMYVLVLKTGSENVQTLKFLKE